MGRHYPCFPPIDGHGVFTLINVKVIKGILFVFAGINYKRCYYENFQIKDFVVFQYLFFQ